jgi:histidine kinase
MTPAPPRHDGERSPNGLALGDLDSLPGPRPAALLPESPDSPAETPADTPAPATSSPGLPTESLNELMSESSELTGGAARPEESLGATQRRREAEQWVRRRLLERQLHDGASLRISALALRLGLLRYQSPRDEDDWQQRIAELQDELHAVLQELRAVSAQIYPPLLDQAGLGPALRELADQSDADVEIIAGTDRFGPVAEGAAYFAVAECLAARPAGGRAVLRVTIERAEQDLLLTAIGVGPEQVGSMLDQAHPLGGTVNLFEGDTPDNGTITVRIPCE